METYTQYCPGCGAGLEFDANSQKMWCKYCNEYYLPELLDGAESRTESSTHYESTSGTSDADTMEMNIYSCRSCGAEVMTGDVEVSTFCAYCGQPALMYDRVSREKKPDKVIPFMLTKEQALSEAKSKFSKAQFQGNTVNELEVDSVHGIYMPYWNFGMLMNVEATVVVRNNKHSGTYIDQETLQKEIMVDGSKRFNDDIAFYLNPYDISAAKPFNIAYLSGFYADCSDDSIERKQDEAKERIANVIRSKILNRNPGVPQTEMVDTYDMNSIPGLDRLFEYHTNSVDCVTGHVDYYFLPVYFITFNIRGQKVIILVNGQTGKVVGNIPVIEEEMKKKQLVNMIVFAVIFAAAGGIVMGFVNILWGAMLIGILGLSFYLAGRASKKKYLSRYEKTNSENMFNLTGRSR